MDLSLMERHSRGIVVLHETKSGQRTASSETVVIFDAYLVRMLAIVCRDLAASGFPRGMFSRRVSSQVCTTRARSWTPQMQLETL